MSLECGHGDARPGNNKTTHKQTIIRVQKSLPRLAWGFSLNELLGVPTIRHMPYGAYALEGMCLIG